MQRSILPIAVVSAVIGAGAAVGVVEGLDLGPAKTTTTLVQQAPLGATSNANDGDTGLTAGDIYKRDAPGVVFVRSQVVQRTQSPFDFGLPQEQQGEATGSGFVIDKAGTILTNAHVVDGATKVTVQFAEQAERRGEGPRQGRVDRHRAAEGRPGGRSISRRCRSAPRRTSRSAIRPSPSAIPSASSARSPPASSPPSSARSRRPTTSRSTTCCRPTRRSTRATPAAR